MLMYVGSTGRLGLRLAQHQRKQPWWPQVGDIAFEDCVSREEAYVIEDEAIELEQPLYNRRRNFAEKVAADMADDEAYRAASGILLWMAPMVYLLGKLAVRNVRWQVEARRALLAGPLPDRDDSAGEREPDEPVLSLASTRLSISAPIRSTKPSATASS
jgi:hypothetical protein